MSKVVFITGTNSGFGKLTVKLLSDKGYKVYAAMRNTKSKNADAANELKTWANVTVLDADVTSTASVNTAVKKVIDAEGRIDVVVNNAGTFTSGITESFTEEDFEQTLDVNVKGPWRVLRAALPQLRKQGEGLIINISSGLGRFSAPFMAIYNSTKFALEGLVEGSHYELRPLGVDNVLIQPGVFPTELSGKTMLGSDLKINESYGEIAAIPGKIGEALQGLFASEHAPNPQLVADAVLKLIETPKGKRPLRTVVDPLTGTFTNSANTVVSEEYAKFMGAFGLGHLLN